MRRCFFPVVIPQGKFVRAKFVRCLSFLSRRLPLLGSDGGGDVVPTRAGPTSWARRRRAHRVVVAAAARVRHRVVVGAAARQGDLEAGPNEF